MESRPGNCRGAAQSPRIMVLFVCRCCALVAIKSQPTTRCNRRERTFVTQQEPVRRKSPGAGKAGGIIYAPKLNHPKIKPEINQRRNLHHRAPKKRQGERSSDKKGGETCQVTGMLQKKSQPDSLLAYANWGTELWRVGILINAPRNLGSSTVTGPFFYVQKI